MDYSTIDPNTISVDVNNNIVIPQPVTLDTLNAQSDDLTNQLEQAQSAQAIAQGALDTATAGLVKKRDDAATLVTSIQTKITALQALITAATGAGAVTTSTFEANQAAKIAPTPMTL